MRRLILLALATTPLAACGDNDTFVTWRSPCGGDGQYVLGPSIDYAFEHDVDGRLTYARQDWSDRDEPSLWTREWDGDNIVHETYTGYNGAYTYDAIVEDGNVVSATTTDQDGDTVDDGYVRAQRWEDNRLVEWEENYAIAARNQRGMIEYSGGQYDALTCYSDGRPCDRSIGVGVYGRGTHVDVDLGDNASVDRVITRTYDAHDLLLIEQVEERWTDSTVTTVTEYVREPDGTALTKSIRELPYDPLTDSYGFFLTYDFACD